MEAFFAIFSQIKTPCSYSLFGQNILEIRSFDIFYSCSLFFGQNWRKNRYFCFFLKNTLFWLFLLHFSQNLLQTTLMRYLKGFLLLFLQSPRKEKSLFRSIIAWLGVILKFHFSREHLGDHNVGTSKIWNWPNCSKITENAKITLLSRQIFALN